MRVIGQASFPHIKPNGENAEIAAVFAVDQVAEAVFDGLGSESAQHDIKHSNRQSQPGETQEMLQTRSFQIKVMAFEISEHFFGPPAPGLVQAGLASGGQIGGLHEAAPPIFSFIFGVPSQEILSECRRRGIVIIGILCKTCSVCKEFSVSSDSDMPLPGRGVTRKINS